MNGRETTESTFESALALSAEWRLLGLLFERPRPGWREAVEAIAREVRDPELCAAAMEAAGAEEGDYLRILGPGGAVPVREAGYHATGNPGEVLADIAAFYRAFAFRPSTEDPPDHVAVLSGFAGFLRLKEAYARMRGDLESAETTLRALDRFAGAHLRVMAGPLARRLAGVAPSYLVRAAASLVARAGDSPESSCGIGLPGETEEAGFCCGDVLTGRDPLE